MNNAYLRLSILLLISSCSPKITYMMSDIAASEKGNNLNNVSVSIVITEDNRRDESPYKQTIFSDRFKKILKMLLNKNIKNISGSRCVGIEVK